MTVASLAHSNIYRAEIRRNKRAKKSFAFAYVLFFVIFVCGFSYVFVTNDIATKGYEIRSLTKQANELESTNESLQVEVSNLKSVNMLEAKSTDLQMVKAQKIDYVSLPMSSAMLIK